MAQAMIATSIKATLTIANVAGSAGVTPKRKPAKYRPVEGCDHGPDRVVDRPRGCRFEGLFSLPFGPPVLDMTGLTGTFDITFNRPSHVSDSTDAWSSDLRSAIEKQLGLRLDRGARRSIT